MSQAFEEGTGGRKLGLNGLISALIDIPKASLTVTYDSKSLAEALRILVFAAPRLLRQICRHIRTSHSSESGTYPMKKILHPQTLEESRAKLSCR